MCYELPSKVTLHEFLLTNEGNVPVNAVYDLANDLIQTIAFLSSEYIVHNAVDTKNIIMAENEINVCMHAIEWLKLVYTLLQHPSRSS